MTEKWYRYKVSGKSSDGKSIKATGIYREGQDPVLLAFLRERELLGAKSISVLAETDPCITVAKTMFSCNNRIESEKSFGYFDF